MAICPGIYHLTDARDGWLARVRLIGGRITAERLAVLAAAAAAHGNGIIELTHRANVQVRGLSSAGTESFAAMLVADGIATADRQRDRLRNIAAPPLAGIDPSELTDVTPLARTLDEALLTAPGIGALSPKFSFVIDGGGDYGVSGLSHDVGFIAEADHGGAIEFRLSLAGHATDLIVPTGALAAVAIALALRCAEAPPQPARMVAQLANGGMDAIVAQLLEDVAEARQFSRRPRQDGSRTTFEQLPTGPFVGSRGGRAVPAIVLGVPAEMSTAATLATVADLSRRHGDGDIRVTPWGSIVIGGIAGSPLAEVVEIAAASGFVVRPSPLRIVACAGLGGCRRAGYDTKAAARRLSADFAATPSGGFDRPTTIHFTGCRRGCAHPAASDILLLPGDGDRLRFAVHAAAASAPADSDLAEITRDELPALARRIAAVA